MSATRCPDHPCPYMVSQGLGHCLLTGGGCVRVVAWRKIAPRLLLGLLWALACISIGALLGSLLGGCVDPMDHPAGTVRVEQPPSAEPLQAEVNWGVQRSQVQPVPGECRDVYVLLTGRSQYQQERLCPDGMALVPLQQVAGFLCRCPVASDHENQAQGEGVGRP